MAVIQSGNTPDLAVVDGNGDLHVVTPTVASRAGFMRLLDSKGRQIITTENGALTTSTDLPLWFDQVDGNAVDINKWNQTSSGMTIAQAGGFLTLNSGNAVTANAYATINSHKYMPLYGHLPCRVSINAKVSIQPESNATMEFGIGLAATTSAPTDGAYFRWNASGQFLAVINNAGTETSIALSGDFTELDGTTVTLPPTTAEAEIYDLIMVEDLVQFLVGDVVVAEVEVPAGMSYPTSAGRLPVFARVYNAGSAPAVAPQISIGQVVIVQEGAAYARPWSETLAICGRGAYQSPVTPFAQTANHTNSTSPSSATLSNTAAGYTTLGGRYQFAAIAGAVTDYAIFAYQVPAGYQLIVTGVAISMLVSGAAISIVTPSVFDWALGVNSSAVSLATTDGAGTWAPRRIPVGTQAFQLALGVGTCAADIGRDFEPPLVIEGGRFFHVIVQCPIGAATGSQIFRGDVMVNGFFE